MKIAYGAAQGLEYLHDKTNPPIVYRELKSSNFLLDQELKPKLSDYGLGKLGNSGDKTLLSSSLMGTYGYCALECSMGGEVTVKFNVYSFGVVLLELITGRRALDTSTPSSEQNLVSWRPEKYLGDVETWDKAEAALTEALNELGQPWQINEGDGAFYGPKIDIGVFDALKRKFQCATLQLDFQLPLRFKLIYSVEDEAKLERPVMIHRAILGSVERMLAILLEHYKGKWPFWLSPRQAMVCPVSDKSENYGKEVQKLIHQAGYFVDIDTSDRTMQKRCERLS